MNSFENNLLNIWRLRKQDKTYILTSKVLELLHSNNVLSLSSGNIFPDNDNHARNRHSKRKSGCFSDVPKAKKEGISIRTIRNLALSISK